METRDRLNAPHEQRRLGVRVREIQKLPRIQNPESEHEPFRIQIDLLHGMDPPTLG